MSSREILSRYRLLAEAQVVPEAGRCVQCGIYSYNCPIGIDVRAHARRARPILDSRCLTCGQCVANCPRGVLAFERIPLLTTE
jgi:ferredoxin